MKVQVTVELDMILPDAAAREMARQIVEGKGFKVARVTIPTDKAAGKPFVPKAGAPGSKLTRGGVTYTVWGDAPTKGEVWATREGSSLYWSVGKNWASAFHPDGTPHSSRCACGRGDVAA